MFFYGKKMRRKLRRDAGYLLDRNSREGYLAWLKGGRIFARRDEKLPGRSSGMNLTVGVDGRA